MPATASSIAAIGLLAVACSVAAEPRDPGKQPIGALDTLVLLATDSDPDVAGPRARHVDAAIVERLRNEPNLSFDHYRLLGADSGPIFRSYENWAEPLKPSDEVLVRFEAQSRPTTRGLRLDLELWLSRKKILKTDVAVTAERPIFILGPEWRGGRLIVAVALAQGGAPGP